MKLKSKCITCRLVFNDEDLTNEGKCPLCNNTVVVMCPRDHCHCSHPVTEILAFCPDCGAPMCPKCESHDVAQISRVTGYIQEVGGWNVGKQQELKDRKRYDVA
jgi:hypothetical protein